jgi:hypothetical protein
MVVTVVAMWVMEVPIHEVVDVISVGYRLMAAAWTVDVIFVVAFAVMVWSAFGGVCCVHVEAVLINMIAVWVVKVTVVQVIDVIVVPDRGVSAVWAMLMIVVFVLIAYVAHVLSVGCLRVSLRLIAFRKTRVQCVSPLSTCVGEGVA